MNDKVKFTTFKKDTETWTRIRVNSHAPMIINTFKQYMEPVRHTQNATFFEVKGTGLEKKILAYLLENIKREKQNGKRRI